MSNYWLDQKKKEKIKVQTWNFKEELEKFIALNLNNTIDPAMILLLDDSYLYLHSFDIYNNNQTPED